MDCAVTDSASLALPSPLGTDGRLVEEMANERAVFVFSRGAGGAKVGDGYSVTVASEWFG